MELDEVEEGELSNDSDAYTPLERPLNYGSLNAQSEKKIESESEDELQTSSASDSDSDTQQYRAKKPKIKLKHPVKLKENPKRKRYDIWSKKLHEDLLSETLTSCDVTRRDRSRDVESYDYTLSNTYYKNEREKGSNARTNNKRTRNDRRNSALRLTKNKKEEKEEKGSIRYILDLNVTADSTETDVATEIANKLCEQKEDLMIKIVTVVGIDKAKSLFNEVKRIEAEGGMMIMNQSRRRTPGGVFFFLVKHDQDLSKEQYDAIFESEKQKFKEEIKKKKKQRALEMKSKIDASKTNTNLPELLTKAELVQKLNKDNWSPKRSDDQEDVVNPPPTPETDGHADSGDGMESSETQQNLPVPDPNNSYENDFLDINTGNDMDMF